MLLSTVTERCPASQKWPLNMMNKWLCRVPTKVLTDAHQVICYSFGRETSNEIHIMVNATTYKVMNIVVKSWIKGWLYIFQQDIMFHLTCPEWPRSGWPRIFTIVLSSRCLQMCINFLNTLIKNYIEYICFSL